MGETAGAGVELALLESFFDELESFLLSYDEKYINKRKKPKFHYKMNYQTLFDAFHADFTGCKNETWEDAFIWRLILDIK